jgi:hypothetical protein
MSTTLLMAAAAAAALMSGTHTAAPHHPKIATHTSRTKSEKILWNQNSNANGYYVGSQNNTSGVYATSDDQAADDFVVPKGKIWTITEVDAGGRNVGVGPPDFETVTFYKDSKGVPGTPVKNGTFNVQGGIDDGSLSIPLGKGVKLRSGKYWISVVANDDAQARGIWQWAETGTTKGYEAMWQDPTDSDGVCQTWDTLADCLGTPTADLMFTLRGKSKSK